MTCVVCKVTIKKGDWWGLDATYTPSLLFHSSCKGGLADVAKNATARESGAVGEINLIEKGSAPLREERPSAPPDVARGRASEAAKSPRSVADPDGLLWVP